MDVARVEAIEKELDTFVERRARDSEGARARANAEDAFWRSRDARRTHAIRLVNAKAWAAYHGGQALLHHDLAAQAAQKRDEALARVRELEAGSGGGVLVE